LGYSESNSPTWRNDAAAPGLDDGGVHVKQHITLQEHGQFFLVFLNLELAAGFNEFELPDFNHQLRFSHVQRVGLDLLQFGPIQLEDFLPERHFLGFDFLGGNREYPTWW
jgi:hypothetical protein